MTSPSFYDLAMASAVTLGAIVLTTITVLLGPIVRAAGARRRLK